MGAVRTGTICNEPHTHFYRRGVGYVSGTRWVGEITIHGKRYRKRSAYRDVVEFWLENMINRFNDE